MGAALSAKELAELSDVPEETLAKILQRLVKAGLLHSRHGAHGGYILALDPWSFTVLDVVNATSSSTRSHKRTVPSSDPNPLRVVSQAVQTALGQLTIARM